MSALTAQAIDAARSAVGRVEMREQVLERESLRRFAVAIGRGAESIENLPVLAHWAWFLPTPGDAEIGPDGHPSRGEFLPAITALPRRMFASTALSFAGPLELERPASLSTTIIDVRHKAGRSGDLVFAEVERRIEQSGEERVRERQTVVYRGPAGVAPAALPDVASDACASSADGQVWTPSPVNLFRFSAVTFNGHRIHYDRPYATAVEGYPALVVHGPFLAAKLAELAARQGLPTAFEFRAQAPCFVDQPIRLLPRGEGEFHAVRCDGVVATIARAQYR